LKGREKKKKKRRKKKKECFETQSNLFHVWNIVNYNLAGEVKIGEKEKKGGENQVMWIFTL